MTPDELQRLAREAGLLPRQEQAPGIDGAVGYWIAIARFAALVRAQALEDERARVKPALDALRYFIGAQHPVATEIDERGRRWVEPYLDEALAHGIAAIRALKSAP
jgi:hypothetical protein